MLWEALAVRRMAQAKDDSSRQAASRARAKAQELIESSWTAYERASALMPHDVRVVNDTGLIMAYYKRTDPDLAETYFQRSIVDGAVQLEDPALTDEQRPILTEAWGDAHENMGHPGVDLPPGSRQGEGLVRQGPRDRPALPRVDRPAAPAAPGSLDRDGRGARRPRRARSQARLGP